MKKIFSFLLVFSIGILVFIGILYTFGVLPNPKTKTADIDTMVVYKYIHITELDSTGRYIVCRYCAFENPEMHLYYCLNPNKNKPSYEKK